MWDQHFAWLVSLLVEIISLCMTSYALATIRRRTERESESKTKETRSTEAGIASGSRMREKKQPPIHPYEVELSRRKRLLLWYLIRSPFFDRTTLPMLRSVASVMSRVPLLGAIPAQVLQVLVYFNRCYFYTAGSS